MRDVLSARVSFYSIFFSPCLGASKRKTAAVYTRGASRERRVGSVEEDLVHRDGKNGPSGMAAARGVAWRGGARCCAAARLSHTEGHFPPAAAPIRSKYFPYFYPTRRNTGKREESGLGARLGVPRPGLSASGPGLGCSPRITTAAEAMAGRQGLLAAAERADFLAARTWRGQKSL